MSTTPTQEAFTWSRSDRGIVHASTYICAVILIWTFAHRNDLRSEWCIINMGCTLILKSIQVKSSGVVYIWNTFSLSHWISNDDFIKIRKQKCADVSAGEIRHPVHSLPNNKTRPSTPPPPHILSTSWYIIQAQLLYRQPRGTGTGNAASSTISFLSDSTGGVAPHPEATVWRGSASKDLHTTLTSPQPHVWQT